MNVLVAYGSKHGATKGIADRIAARLQAEGQRAAVRPVEAVDDLEGYDAFVIGSAVYGGRWAQQAIEFIRRHRATLASRPVWLFSSGPIGTMATRYEPVEPKGVTAIRRALSPRDHRVFFGAWDRSRLDPSQLGFAERIIAK
jgi:menaquinone-dependent protoporphyrinogen oxidase